MTRTETGLGCWQFGGGFGFWENQDRRSSVRVVHAAVRYGIRHFDTAAGYGNGRSEQLLGQQLKRFSSSVPRSSYAVATKIMPNGKETVRKNILKSLRRLCTSYVDILYLHWPADERTTSQTLEEMAASREDGLVGAVGICNVTPSLLERLPPRSVDYVQIPCSLLWTRDERRIRDIAEERGIRTVGYSPLGMGTLTRKPGDPAPGDARAGLYCFSDASRSRYDDLLAAIGECAKRKACSAAAVAAAWALGQSFDILLLGARDKTQLSDTLTGRNVVLSAEETETLTDLAQRLSATAPAGQDDIFGHGRRQ